MALGRKFVVALHRRAFAREDGAGEGGGRACIGARETAARDERDTGAAEARARAARVGDTRNGERRFFRFRGNGGKRLGGRLGRLVFDIEVRPVAREKSGIGEAAPGIVRRNAGHRDGALDHGTERGLRKIGGGDACLLLADEDAKPDIAALRALDILEFAEAPGNAKRGSFEDDRLRCLRPRLARALDQHGRDVEDGFGGGRAHEAVPAKGCQTSAYHRQPIPATSSAIQVSNVPTRRGAVDSPVRDTPIACRMRPMVSARPTICMT